MNTRLLSLTLILVLMAASCSATPSANPPGETFQALNRDGFNNYTSTFVILFDGSVKWAYQLESRKADGLSEKRLHIEGIAGSQNPGDVRLVTDGTTSWMIGPGTDNECIQFPNGQGLDPTWIYPETLIAPSKLAEFLQPAGEAEITGKRAEQFSGSTKLIADWQDARIDVWLDRASQGLLQYNMQAKGNDPFFGTGSGLISVRYIVDSLDQPAIEPVQGCEISVPLPESAVKFVRLPGLASFESASALEEITAFYQQQLPATGWTELKAPQQGEGATILSYTRGNEQVEIHLEAANEGGSAVKLIFLQAE